MKKADIQISGIYAVKVSGRIVPVQILREYKLFGESKGWQGKNLVTGRAVRIKTAGRLRYKLTSKNFGTFPTREGRSSLQNL